MKFTIIALVFAVSAAGTQCCDPYHDGYAKNQSAVQLCIDKGGIPITNTHIDNGGHGFQLLTQCAFPCDQRPAAAERAQ